MEEISIVYPSFLSGFCRGTNFGTLSGTLPFSGKTKEPECLDFKSFQAPTEQGMRESNSHQRFWRPLSYHLTNPLHFLSVTYYTKMTYYYVISLVLLVPSKLHTDSVYKHAGKSGHLDSASLHLDDFATQNSVCIKCHIRK